MKDPKLKQLCVIKWYVKDGVWRRKIMCVTELCGKDGVYESDVCVCEGGSSATRTQNEGGCHQVPHLPRKMPGDQAVQVCHAVP